MRKKLKDTIVYIFLVLVIFEIVFSISSKFITNIWILLIISITSTLIIKTQITFKSN